jgi:hypothetical protein
MKVNKIKAISQSRLSDWFVADKLSVRLLFDLIMSLIMRVTRKIG